MNTTIKLLAIIVLSIIFMESCKKDSSSTSSSTTTDPNLLYDSRDGKTYKTVKIGTQTWMAENLNFATSVGSWAYNDSSKYSNIYGRLYNWAAIMQGTKSRKTSPSGVKGVCPSGWHLPSDEEWCILSTFLDTNSDCTPQFWTVSKITGKKLKENGTTHWNKPNIADNSSGFTALPSGGRKNTGSFSELGNSSYFWSCTETETDTSAVWLRELFANDSTLTRNGYVNGKTLGFSVRCVKN